MDFYLNTFKVNDPKFSNDSIESIDYDELQSMYEELEHSPKIFQPSNLWMELSKIHEKRLKKFGINIGILL
ncbi:MAG: hypothetical protein ACW9W4_01985 [Candidatus Nitrosopumilus sp. bin_7KS]